MPLGDPVLDYDGLTLYNQKLKQWIAGENSDIVHKDGEQTLTGLKTIANEIHTSEDHPDRKSSILHIRMPGYTKYGPGASDNIYGTVVFRDDTEYSNFPNGWVGSVEAQIYQTGLPIVSLLCYSQDPATPNAFAYVRVSYDSDGNAVAIASPTSDARTNRNDIITRGFLLDHYARKRRYNSIPVFSITLAENTAVSVSEPYSVTLPSAVSGCLFSMTYPTESSNAAGRVTALRNGQSVAWAGCNIHHNGAAYRNYVSFGDINGVFTALRFYGAQEAVGTVQTGALDSSPTFGNVQIDELQITPATGSDVLTAGVSIAVYALEEV